jgi:hypothetical protein
MVAKSYHEFYDNGKFYPADSSTEQYKFNTQHTAKDKRISYRNAAYPWIEAVSHTHTHTHTHARMP